MDFSLGFRRPRPESPDSSDLATDDGNSKVEEGEEDDAEGRRGRTGTGSSSDSDHLSSAVSQRSMTPNTSPVRSPERVRVVTGE